MPDRETGWTADMVRALPEDGKRYEVVGGALLVTPAPSWAHQAAVGFLYRALHPWLARHRAGVVIFAPADVEFDQQNMVEPDLFVVPLVEGRRPRDFAEAGRLLLAVEVLLPSTARADRHLKRQLYQRERVAEYWIVDQDARLVERWTPSDERPEILTERIEWRPASEHEPLVIQLAELFAE